MTPDPLRTPANPNATPTLPGATLPQEAGDNLFEAPTIAPRGSDSISSALNLPNLAPPGFAIIGTLGRGGMGVVYHAKQTKLNREVALKMILAGGHANEEDRARFLAEGHAIAALNHPGIVQVYEFGEHAGQPYFALEYCPGGSLARQLDGTPLKGRAAARIVQRLAHAVQAAHDKGIVHRDLKPANVLIAEDGFQITELANEPSRNSSSDATLQSEMRSLQSTIKITDFGLAKRLESESDLTRSGAIVGTPSYMAPEQAGGNAKDVGPAADVYALGAILYELLTGRPPFKEARPIDTVLRVINDEPISISQLQKNTPLDLETICHKCLRKEPRHRYPSAKELGRDLGRWLDGEPIQARPVGRVEKAVKWAKRRPAVAGLLGLSVVAIAILIAGGIYYNSLLVEKGHDLNYALADVGRKEVDLETERANVLRSNDEAKANLARSKLLLADITWKDRDALGTLKALSEVPEDLRQWEWGYKQRLALGSYATLWGHIGRVWSVASSPDGRRLASGSEDKTVRVWDAQTGALIQTLTGHTAGVFSVSFSPDGRRLASGSHDKTVRLWDVQSGSVVQTLAGHTNPVVSVAFSPDGRRLASGSADHTVRVWDAQTGSVVQTLAGHTGTVSSVAFSPDGRRLASGGVDKTVRLWDLQTGAVVQALNGHTRWVFSVAFSPDGTRLASGSDDRTVRLWDAQTGAVVQTLAGHIGSVQSVAFSPDGTRLASGSVDNTVRVWDAQSGAVFQALAGHTGWVFSVAFSPDGRRLASGSHDMTVRLWDAQTGAVVQTLTHNESISRVAFSPDGRRLASGSGEKTVRLWDVQTGAVVQTLAGHDDSVTSVAFSPDGQRLASGSIDKTVRIWDAQTGGLVQTFTGHTERVCCVAFSPDGRRLASSSDDKTVCLWDVQTGTKVQTLSGHTYWVWSVAFSPDGRRLASGSHDMTVRLWDAQTGALVHTLAVVNVGIASAKAANERPGAGVQKRAGHTNSVTSVAFSPDGRRLASGSEDKSVLLWDVQTGALVQTLTGHTGRVFSVAFSPDGRRLASGSVDKTVRVWDAQTGALVQTLTGHIESVFSVAFSPDGRRLASVSVDKTVRLWDAQTGAVVHALIGLTGPVRSVAFSPDGRRLAGQGSQYQTKAWALDSRRETGDNARPQWLPHDSFSSRSPDGQWYAIPHEDGTILLVKPLPPDEFELGYRAWFARPDPDWHWQQAQKFEKESAWFAAKFHSEQVLKSRPDDAAAKTLLEKARAEWEKVKAKDAEPTKP